MHVYMYMYTCKFTLVFSYQNNEPQKSGGQPANLNPHKIVAGSRAVAPPIQMGFSLDVEQLWRPICLMIVSQPLELGATM